MAQRTLPQQLLHDLKNGLIESDLCMKHNLKLSQVRSMIAEAKNDERVELVRKIKLSKDRGLSNVSIAQRLNLSEATVRDLLTYDAYKVVLSQKGTDNKVVLDVLAPMGTPYEDVVSKVKANPAAYYEEDL